MGQCNRACHGGDALTLLTIAKSVARNVGVTVPSAVLSSSVRENVLLAQFSSEAAIEIARRVDWSALRKATTITGTGANANFALPSDFSRLTAGMAVKTVSGGVAVRGGVSADEWFSLIPIEATPRYFRLLGTAISFYPYPAVAEQMSVSYQSKNWCSNDAEDWTTDDDTALVPEDLVIKGAIWRWKRHIGGDYQDYLAEFEAAIADFARFDNGARMP